MTQTTYDLLQNIADLLQNVALLVALAVGLQLLTRRFEQHAVRYQLFKGLLFGIVGVVGMMTPMQFAPGVIYDGRSIVLSLAGLFGGGTTALIAGLLCAAYRLYLGGPGALAGVLVIAEAAALGTLLHYLRRRGEGWVSLPALWAFGLLVHAIMMLLQLLIPDNVGFDVFRQVGPIVLVLYPVGFLLAAQVFLEGERKHASDLALRESEDRYRSLFENNHAVMLLIDPDDGHIVDANPAAEAFYGWTRQQLRSMNIAEINMLSESEVRAEMERAQSARRNQFFFRHRLADGSVRDVEVFSGPIAIEAKGLLYSIVHDVTDRAQAYTQLEENEQFLEAVLESIQDGISVLEPDLTIRHVNAVMNTWYAHALPLEGKKCYEVYQGRSEACESCPTLKALQTGQTESTIVPGPSDSPTEWIELFSYPMKDPQSGQVTGVVEFVRDITASKRAERAEHDRHRELEQVFEAMPEALIYADTQRRILRVNTAFVKMFGYAPEEVIGKTTEVIYARHEDFLEQGRVRFNPEARDVSAPYEIEYRRKNGEIFPVEMVAAIIRDAEDRVAGLLGLARDITERRRAEAAIRESEQKFRSLVEQAAEMLFLHDTQGRILDVNRQAELSTGYTRQELLGMTVFDVDPHSHDLEGLQRFWEALSPGDPPVTFESRHRRKDGAVYPAEVTLSKIALAEGAPILALARDITERKQAEDELLHSRDLMRYIIEHVHSAVAVHDRNLHYIYVSQRYLDQYEVKDPNIIGKHHYAVFPDLPQKWRDIHQKALAGEVSRADRDPYYREDGRMDWTRWECRPWYEADGAIGGIVVYTEVITEQLRVEQALRENEERFRTLVEGAPDAIFVQTEKTFAYLNAAAVELFGASSAEQLLGQPVMERFHPSFREAVRARIAQLNRHKQRVPLLEEIYLRLDGTEVPVEVAAVPTVYDGKDGAIVFVRDTTERKNLQAQLAQAQKMESVGRLAGGVAHDFNNMLNVILGHSEILLEQLTADNPLRADLEEIRSAAHRSADLTRQLLAFARRQTIAPKVLDLNDTITSMLKMLGRLIGEDIALLWKPGSAIEPVHLDPAQIDQMLANLVVNARDAIGPRVGKITIETAQVEFDDEYCASHAGFLPGRYAMLAVSDDGHGMDQETRAQIFEPFFTTKDLGEGTGLGLATVYGIVRQNRGFINVYSEPGEGTTFRIYLPVYVTEKPAQAATKAPTAAARQGRETILLVEDEAMILTLGKRILERLGYTVLDANSPGEALELIEQYTGEIHLLVTDIVMPGMNGRDLAHRVQDMYPGINVLFTSGYTANVIAHHGVLDEGTHFIQKPFSIAELSAKIREALDAGPSGNEAAP